MSRSRATSCLNVPSVSAKRLPRWGLLALVVAALTMPPVHAVDLASGLVGYWPLDGNANDASQYANHGTVTGTLTYSDHGAFGQSATFDDAGNKYVTVAHQNQYEWTGDFAIQFWYKPGTQRGRILQKHFPTDDGTGTWEIYYESATSNMVTINPRGQTPFSNSYPPPAGWSHFVYTYTAATRLISLYINGSLYATQTYGADITPFDRNLPLTFMYERQNANLSATGQLDEVALWNRSLSGAEAYSLYKLPLGGAWRQTTTYPVNVYECEALVHANRLYVAGGWNGTAVSAINFAPINAGGSLGAWVSAGALPESAGYAGTTVYNGWMYIALFNGNTYYAQVNGDGTLGSWTSSGTPAANRGGRLSTRAYRGYLYVFGGWTGSTFYSSVYMAKINSDGSLGTWTATTSMPEVRQHVSVNFYNGRAYLAGGITDGLAILSSVRSTGVLGDGTLSPFRQETSLPNTLWYHNSVQIGNKLLIIGGRSGYDSGNQNAIWQSALNSASGSVGAWAQFDQLPGSYVQAPGTAYDPSGYLYVVGGGTGAGTTNQVWYRAVEPAATEPDQSGNVVPNDGAEQGSTTPANWSSIGPAAPSWATDAAHTGTRSLKLVSTGGNSGWTQPAILLPEPWPYTVTFGGWSQADNVNAGASFYGLQFQVTFEDMTTTWFASGLMFTKGTHGWENMDQTVTFTKRVRQIVPYGLLYGGSGTQTVWFDDLYAIPRETVTANYQMEDGSAGVGPDNWWTGANDLSRAAGWATDEAASGSHALKISKASSGSNAYWYGNTFTFPASDQPYTLTFSGWSKAAGVSASGGLYTLYYYVTFADATTTAYVTGLGFTSGTHDWQYVQRTNTFAKPIASVRPYALFYNRTGTAWFDDIAATPASTVTHNHLAQDGTAGVGPDNWWTANNDLTRSSGWATDASHSSDRSLKIARASAGANATWSGQTFTFPADRRPYTLNLSGWHKAESVAASGSTFGLYYLVTLADSSTVGYATGLAGTTGSHDWLRLSKTATFAQPVASVRPYGLMYGRTGTVWFDDLAAAPCDTVSKNCQVEDGTAGVGPDDWITFSNGLTRVTGWATDAYYDGARSLKLVNSTDTNAGWYGAEFTFPAGSYPGTLTVSAWNKASGVAATETTMYGVMLLVTFSDDTRRWYGVDGNTGTHDWQKIEDQIVFPKSVKKFRPYLVLYGGTGTQTAWFDRITIKPQ